MRDIDEALIRDVDLLCLDAGNTIVFLDHRRLAAACARQGFATTVEALVRAEGEAKIALESGTALDVGWSADVASSRSWGVAAGTIVHRAGLAAGRVSRVLDALWSEHRARNFWCRVPDGLSGALARARRLGVRTAVVSNSEGALEALLDELGILRCFDLVVDSGVVGVEKPDPAIFRLALDRLRVPAARALHLGDTVATDVVGARAAGVRVALVDPYGHFEGRHPELARVPGAPEVAGALAAHRAAAARAG